MTFQTRTERLEHQVWLATIDEGNNDYGCDKIRYHTWKGSFSTFEEAQREANRLDELDPLIQARKKVNHDYRHVVDSRWVKIA